MMFKIGYVSGMFDILHVGHIKILKYAKTMCKHLIVAVGTDDFIRWRKNHEPIMPYIDRVEIVSSLRYVDEVVPGIDLDKIAAYNKYHFDVMIAGSDHIGEQAYVKAEKKLKELGVTTLYYPRIADISSTEIKKKLNKQKNEF